MTDREKRLGEACEAIARAVFPHFTDFSKREPLKLALVQLSTVLFTEFGELVETIGSDIGALELRIGGLEKDSHPPVPLRPIIIEEVRAAMKTLTRRRLG